MSQEQHEWNMIDFEKMSKNFDFDGTFVSAEHFGCGHINSTFLLTFKKDDGTLCRYVLQSINQNVFKNINGLMDNIISTQEYLKRKVEEEGGNIACECLRFIKSKKPNGTGMGAEYLFENFRAYHFVEGTETYQKAESVETFADAGRAFGTFVRRLCGFPAETLFETIPDFHNTKKRFGHFLEAVKNGVPERVKAATPEITFVKAREKYANRVVELLSTGELPHRVAHNDTKLNNVLFDSATQKAVCVIDLDTIMQGSLLYDFGDAVRSGCSTALEDEPDLSKVNFDKELYDAFSKSFIEALGDNVVPKERELLPFAAILMTYECGMRFLADYLVGDVYFKTTYPEHNLVRARTQFKLVSDMEKIFGIK